MRQRLWSFAAVVTFAVACGGGGSSSPPPPSGYTVGGAIAGLGSASGLVVSAAGQTFAVPAGATSYTFPARFQDGTYSLSLTAPAGIRCTPANDGVVVVSGADVTSASITCAAVTYRLGGTVVGLPTGSVVLLQDGAGHQVTADSDGPFAFGTRLAAGTAYTVAVVTQPSGHTCSVANASGTVGTADVENVQVSCGAATFAIGGAVRGLAAPGLAIASTVPGSTNATVAQSDTRYELPVRAPNGTYTLSFASTPAGVTCAFDVGGATKSVTVNGADVTNADVTCTGVVLQRWAAPTTWGGSAQTFWPDDDPALVQHAWFTAGGIQESKSAAWSLTGGATPTFERLDAFPAGPRYGAGPFPVEGANYLAATSDANLDAPKDMLVCAVFQPDNDPVANGWEKPIISKGAGNYTNYLPGPGLGGWSLMQMHESFCFHYETLDANRQSRNAMAFLPTSFANGNVYGPGNSSPRTNYVANEARSPLPSWVVVCGGRDGEDLVIAVNSVETLKRYSLAPFGPGPHVLDASDRPATIGGYSPVLGLPNSKHVFGGRVYETAVWAQPATAENVREKLALVQGMVSGVSYTRNRPALFQFASVGSGAPEVAPMNAPRIDPTKGMLFGLQGWNRVNGWMPADPNYNTTLVFPASEDLTLWAPNAGATVTQDDTAVTPAGFPRKAQLVTLPAGASLSIPLDQRLDNPLLPPGSVGAGGTPPPPWDSTGFVHGFMWVRVASAAPAGSVLRVHKTVPDPAFPGADHYDIDLATLTPGAWTPVWLNGAAGRLSAIASEAGVLSLENLGSTPISFNAWGVTLTQIAGGGDLNSISAVPQAGSQPSPNPGPFMYDATAANDFDGSFAPTFVQDVLQPPALVGSTAATGFCLSVDASPADALPWDARMHDSRTAIGWANAADPGQVTRVLRLFVEGIDGAHPGQLCFGERTLATAGDWSTIQPEQVHACGPLPAGWTAGSSHNLKACWKSDGQLSLYADYGIPNAGSNTTAIATQSVPNAPDLVGGRLLIGNGVNKASSYSTPWHGYVSRAAACRASDVAACR